MAWHVYCILKTHSQVMSFCLSCHPTMAWGPTLWPSPPKKGPQRETSPEGRELGLLIFVVCTLHTVTPAIPRTAAPMPPALNKYLLEPICYNLLHASTLTMVNILASQLENNKTVFLRRKHISKWHVWAFPDYKSNTYSWQKFGKFRKA